MTAPYWALYRLGDPGLDVYPVGLRADLRQVVNVYRAKGLRFAVRIARHRARCAAPRRSSWWNGYLAEPQDWPNGLRTCGHGWTRRRAVARLNRYVRRDYDEIAAWRSAATPGRGDSDG